MAIDPLIPLSQPSLINRVSAIDAINARRTRQNQAERELAVVESRERRESDEEKIRDAAIDAIKLQTALANDRQTGNFATSRRLVADRAARLSEQGRDRRHTIALGALMNQERFNEVEGLLNSVIQEGVHRGLVTVPQSGDERFDDFDVILPGAEGGEQRIPVSGRIVDGDAQILGAGGRFVPLRAAFPNALRVEPAVGRQEQGEAGAFSGTPTQRFNLQQDLNDRAAAVSQFGATAEGLMSLLEQTPGANTVTAQLANVGDRVLNEARTLVRATGIEVPDSNILSPSHYAETFDDIGLAEANPRIKNGFLGLAIQRASAAGLGEGRALSDRDIDLQLRTLGANQNNPNIVRQIFADSFQDLERGVRFRFQTSANTTQGLQMPPIERPGFLGPSSSDGQGQQQTQQPGLQRQLPPGVTVEFLDE